MDRGGNKGWMDGWINGWMEIGEGIGSVDLGPLSLFFSKWRREPAAEEAVLHVLFFSRKCNRRIVDCFLVLLSY